METSMRFLFTSKMIPWWWASVRKKYGFFSFSVFCRFFSVRQTFAINSFVQHSSANIFQAYNIYTAHCRVNIFAFDIERERERARESEKHDYIECKTLLWLWCYSMAGCASGDHFKYEARHLPMINSHITLDLMDFFFSLTA